MRISIFGLGYVGAVSLACLARDGHSVIGVDVDPAKLELIRSGKTPVVEEGMVNLMAEVAASGRVSVTTDAVQAVMGSDLSLICVGTPSAANGSQDQSAMLKLAHELGRAMRGKTGGHVFVFRSTLVPGTVEDVLRPILERSRERKMAAISTSASSPSSCARALRSGITTGRRSRWLVRMPRRR